MIILIYDYYMFTRKLNNSTSLTSSTSSVKNLCLPNKLFQVPFKKDKIKRYKGISKLKTNDCFFQAMNLLGLRNRSTARKDSLKVRKLNSRGVEIKDAAKYLALIFNANITTKIIAPKTISDMFTIYKHLFIPRTSEPIDIQLNDLLDLKNGYATFICGLYTRLSSIYGHFFIIYKHNNTIYYYDQCKKTHLSVNDLYKDKLIGVVLYYNLSKSCMLIKSKINTEIPIT